MDNILVQSPSSPSTRSEKGIINFSSNLSHPYISVCIGASVNVLCICPLLWKPFTKFQKIRLQRLFSNITHCKNYINIRLTFFDMSPKVVLRNKLLNAEGVYMSEHRLKLSNLLFFKCWPFLGVYQKSWPTYSIYHKITLCIFWNFEMCFLRW